MATQLHVPDDKQSRPHCRYWFQKSSFLRVGGVWDLHYFWGCLLIAT
jgi:hypothetical protein